MTDDDALVEAVARAICRVGFGEADGYDIWDAVGEADRISFRNVARAALSVTPLAQYRAALEEITLIHRDAVTMHTITLKCVHIARKALEGVER
jgi:hypothetical protein